MATGKVASVQMTAASITAYSPIYTVPTNNYGVYNISFTNTTGSSVNIRLAVGSSTSGSVNTNEIIEYQTAVVPYGVFERTGLVLSAGQNIVASTTGTAVNVNVYGIETSTT